MEKQYRVIGKDGRIYLSKSVQQSLGMLPGTIVKITVQKDALRLEPVNLIEIGDHSPEAVESYIRAAGKTLSKEARRTIIEAFLREE